jgi:hypothetical protein
MRCPPVYCRWLSPHILDTVGLRNQAGGVGDIGMVMELKLSW